MTGHILHTVMSSAPRSKADKGGVRKYRLNLWSRIIFFLLLAGVGFGTITARAQTPVPHKLHDRIYHDIKILSSLGDRSSGTVGAGAAADFIEERFRKLGLEEIGRHTFPLAVREHNGSQLTLVDRGITREIFPLIYNAITPQSTRPPGLTGPMIYVGSGEMREFNGIDVRGSIVLMEQDSGRNWQNAASLGARALIFVDRGPTARTFFKDKHELTPIQFPIFWMPLEEARVLFGDFERAEHRILSPEIRISSTVEWKEAAVDNIYGLIPGSDPDLEDEALLVEAFYDSTVLVPGHSPGADEALGMAAFLYLAEYLMEHRPGRSVLMLATSGHAQSLAGMREAMWSLRSRSRDLRRARSDLKTAIDKATVALRFLDRYAQGEEGGGEFQRQVLLSLADRLKTEVDQVSRELMRLRLEDQDGSERELINKLAARRLMLSRLGWRTHFRGMTPDERAILLELVPLARKDYERLLDDAKNQLRMLRSSVDLKGALGSMDIAATFSLHLSSHGTGIGAFNQGFLYDLTDEVNRTGAFSQLDDVLKRTAQSLPGSSDIGSLYRDTLRPSRLRTWDSYFLDRPPLSGEVAALAAYLGVTLVTLEDGRPFWGTPYDVPERMDWEQAVRQTELICGLIEGVSREPELSTGQAPRNGFSSLTGRAKFIRHGELFADQPAPGTVILAYQGPAVYHVTTDSTGTFRLRGMSDRKHTVHKVIIEGYKFDPVSGDVIWAIDKPETGLNSYRVRMQRRDMETDLIMFGCREMTMFNLLEPRSFRYMTRISLIDARVEAEPRRYWYSRIDTRSSVLASIYLEPGTHLKMTLSDSVLNKKMILLNAGEKHPTGTGYNIDRWPIIPNTELHVAQDMWALLEPRIHSLESHGIHNEKIRSLQKEGLSALKEAKESLRKKQYDVSAEAAARSWALASRVYDNVEKTQKDVLFGVLFYIALFVPFAFCLERLLFSYTDIHKRIVSFLIILVVLIGVIYKVHPAFQLAYSPTVVILAFFIMGLSLVVTLIIFFRFEEEMVRLQKRASQTISPEISRWQAFVAAFLLGVSNLRRRRLRTALTCITLIILTFTIMSFTSVSSLRHKARILLDKNAPYMGVLVKNVSWRDLPEESMGILMGALEGFGETAPRVWLEREDRTRPTMIPARRGDTDYIAQGLIGLSPQEAAVTGIEAILTGGRWFDENDRESVLIPERMAEAMHVDPENPQGVVTLWGIPFQIIGVFSGKQLEERKDLDGESLTPVIFPGEVAVGLTELEMEALDSGDEIQAFKARYQHIPGDLTLIVPYRTLLAAGGALKSVSIRPLTDTPLQDTARNLVDRFKLTLFIGEDDGTYMYQASDTLSYSGVPNIVIPLLISIFIVLNTMIGSVFERKREIGIYTSVGLAPSHVSFLFIAESMAFAVLSVVLGYLLAQITAALFVGTGLWAGITVNYSSLAGVAAMIMIFMVVLISVIYPSRVAAQIAIPDVNRSWTMPEAKGGLIEVTLPILLKYKEIRGVGGYMLHYFLGHKDVSHGLFSTGDLKLMFECPDSAHQPEDQEIKTAVCRFGENCERQACLHFRTTVWLAPFDFGIMQSVDVFFQPAADDPGFLEINVIMIRQAGEANIWHRVNKAFINEIRKQLLVWRSLNQDAQNEYETILESARPDQLLEPEK
jgi:hypothetical protein